MTVNWNVFTAWKSEKGRRSENEDSCLVMTSADLGGTVDALLVVADGMGGRASGATASKTAVQAVRDCFRAEIGGESPDFESILNSCLESANDAVFGTATARPELRGMGTTCVVSAVCKGKAYYSYLGDSRAYLLRDGQLSRLTVDHSFVAEKVKTGELTEAQAAKSRFRNIITKAVGLTATAEPDSGEFDIRAGDVLLLCTDGLTTAVQDDEIADILCTSSRPSDACDRLVDSALKHGGRDNITVALGVFGSSSGVQKIERMRESGRPGGRWVVPSLMSLVLGIGLGLYSGRMILPKLVDKPDMRQVHAVHMPDLTHVVYRDPQLLISHIPLEGKVLALDPNGIIYVADIQGKLISVNESGQIDSAYPERETFKLTQSPRSPMLASDTQGNLYISDPAGKKILKFDRSGQFITNIAEGELLAPEALAVDSKGTVYVIDAGRLKAIRIKSAAGAETVK